MNAVIAIDLGASSGRVMVGYLESGKIRLEEFHRFQNQQIMCGMESCWDLDSILNEIKVGIDKVLTNNVKVASLGIDTWGVDFVLMNKQGQHLGEYVSYRDSRTQGVMDKLLNDSGLSKQDVYRTTGIQFLTFNTLYQLKAITEAKPSWLSDIDTLLFIPDYLNYQLCGVKHCEYTNASTSQLLNCEDKSWSESLIKACGAKADWFLPPVMPNQIIGQYQVGENAIPVCSVASHDTASAVAAAPIFNQSTAYLSSGTWSLVGVESLTPVTDAKAFEYNLTNEGGVDGRYRILKNIMGLWLLQRIKAENPSLAFSDIALLASQAKPFEFVVNPNDEDFLNPHSMTEAVKNWFTSRRMPAPQSLSQVLRCIYDSLALAYDDAIGQIADATSRKITELRIVGGGIQDKFLNQLCADVCQITVATAPQEASALGNVINQFISLDVISCLDEGRKIIDASSEVNIYQPNQIAGLDTIKAQYQLVK